MKVRYGIGVKSAIENTRCDRGEICGRSHWSEVRREWDMQYRRELRGVTSQVWQEYECEILTSLRRKAYNVVLWAKTEDPAAANESRWRCPVGWGAEAEGRYRVHPPAQSTCFPLIPLISLPLCSISLPSLCDAVAEPVTLAPSQARALFQLN